MLMNRKFFKPYFLALSLITIISTPALAIEITGAGASFPAPIYGKWAAAYEKATQVQLNYQSIGSGGGIKQIEGKTIDFGASDMPLKTEELNAYGLSQFPVIIGGVIPIINLDGIDAGKVKLNSDLLAAIFLGKITKWNDKKIQELNPDITLPDNNITVVHRADGSGTSFLFTSYLAAVSPEWANKVGANATVSWPVGVGGKGNEGVSAYVQRIKGSIGYVEYAYAFQNKLNYALLQNKAGRFVAPTIASFKNAAASADWANTPGFAVLLIDQGGQEAWPITGASFILIYKKQAKAEQGKEVLKFFDWAFKNGEGMAESLFYVPLPDSVIKLIQDSWKKDIKDSDNKPLWS